MEVSRKQIRTADYSQEARTRLADAVARARTAAGYQYRTDLRDAAKAAGEKLSVRSIQAVELGDPGVGQAVLFAIGRLLPGWTEDTPRLILEGGPTPSVEPPPLIPPAEDKPWMPVLTDAQIIAMSGHDIGMHYIKLEREYGEEAADDWFVKAAIVRRDARSAAREPLATDGS